jgi:hypothetical protein
MADDEERLNVIQHEPEGGDPPCWAHMFDAETRIGEAAEGNRSVPGRADGSRWPDPPHDTGCDKDRVATVDSPSPS